MAPPRATRILQGAQAPDRVALDYEARLIRRRRLTSEGGVGFLVDLPDVVSVGEGDAFELEDGRLIGVLAAPEALISVTGDLPRLAWHIGNRHTPCRIETERLLIRDDHVLAAMLERLGARLTRLTGPFSPEGGAYGHGRTMGHDHRHAPAHD